MAEMTDGNEPASAADLAPAVRVLIADSQPLFAQALAASLRALAGMEVVDSYPRSGVEVAHAAVATRPDVALLDLWLDDVTALAAAQSLAAKTPETAVVILGWFHTAAHIRQALDAGADGFVSKQLPLDELVSVIGRVRSGGCVVADPHLASAANGDAATAPATGDAGTGEPLTPRELEVLQLLGTGLPIEDAAAQLGIRRETVRTHLTRVLGKLGAHSQTQAAAIARRRGLLI